MNLKKPTEKLVMGAAAVAALTQLTACGDISAGKIDGDKWELAKINGLAVSGTTLEFEKDGDFQICYDGDCYDGEWEWNSSKDELDIVYFDAGDSYNIDFEVDLLNKTQLEGTWKYDGTSYEVEFER